MKTRGVFIERVGSTSQWVFKPETAWYNVLMEIECGFEPILFVIVYEIKVSAGRVTRILQMEKQQWNKEIAQDSFWGSYRENESFLDYCTRMGRNNLKEKQLWWVYWDHVQFLRRLFGKPYENHVFLRHLLESREEWQTMVNECVYFQPQVMKELDPPPPRLKERIIRQQFLKAMKLQRTYLLDNDALETLKRDPHVCVDTFLKMQKQGEIVNVRLETYTLREFLNKPVQEWSNRMVPIDFAVDSFTPFVVGDDSLLGGVLSKNKRAGLYLDVNYKVEVMDRYRGIRDLFKENTTSISKIQRVLFVIPIQQYEYSLYATQRIMDCQTYVKKKDPSQVVFLKQNLAGTLICAENGTDFRPVVNVDQFHREHTIRNVCEDFELGEWVRGKFDAIVFYSRKSTYRRWIQYADNICGSDTWLIVTGTSPLLH